MKIFDTHAHYDDDAFIEDKDALLNQMHKEGVERIVNIGCSMKSSVEICEMVKAYDFVYGTVGFHPDCVDRMTQQDIETLRTMARQEKILGIGEIGLDYHYDEIDKDNQKKWFVAQLQLAKEENLPIVIHSRDAAKDTLDIMKAEHNGATNGVIHCFSYGIEMAREYLSMGYFIGVGGVVTFKNAKKLKEVVAYTPLNRIVLETDAPYLAPTPFRGKRNCSSYLQYVAMEIAQLKGVSEEEVYQATYENACRLYKMEKE